jgi:hypothetical protein
MTCLGSSYLVFDILQLLYLAILLDPEFMLHIESCDIPSLQPLAHSCRCRELCARVTGDGLWQALGLNPFVSHMHICCRSGHRLLNFLCMI